MGRLGMLHANTTARRDKAQLAREDRILARRSEREQDDQRRSAVATNPIESYEEIEELEAELEEKTFQIEELQTQLSSAIATKRATQSSIGTTRSSIIDVTQSKTKTHRDSVTTTILALSAESKALREVEAEESNLVAIVEKLRNEAQEGVKEQARIAIEREEVEREVEEVERECEDAKVALLEEQAQLSAKNLAGLSKEERREREEENSLRAEYAWMEETAGLKEGLEEKVALLRKELEVAKRKSEATVGQSERELEEKGKELDFLNETIATLTTTNATLSASISSTTATLDALPGFNSANSDQQLPYPPVNEHRQLADTLSAVRSSEDVFRSLERRLEELETILDKDEAPAFEPLSRAASPSTVEPIGEQEDDVDGKLIAMIEELNEGILSLRTENEELKRQRAAS